MCAKKTSRRLQRFAAATLFTFLTVSAASAQTPQPQGGSQLVRHSDSLVNGALIGAGAGVASGLFFCSTMEPWEICRNDYGAMLKIGAIGAGIGMGIDALIRRNVTATPIVSRQAKGVRLSIRF